MVKRVTLSVALFVLSITPPALSSVNTTAGVSTGKNTSGEVFKIPVRLTSRIFLPKPPETQIPQTLPLPRVDSKLPRLGSKVGLVLPSEIYKPNERVKEEGGFFSCGQPSDKQIYTKAVEAFNKGNYSEAKRLFEKLLAEYPSSPYTLKAAYYIGYIEYVEGNYQKALKTFQQLCTNPYNFPWKKYSCQNAVVAALQLGDYQTAERVAQNVFWKKFLLWLEGKIDDKTFWEFLKHYNCDELGNPYADYCRYVKGYLNPAGELAENLPQRFLRSIELKRLLLKASEGGYITPQLLERYVNNPSVGNQLLELYILGLIKRGDYEQALRWLSELKNRNPEAAKTLAIYLIEKNPAVGGEVLKIVPAQEVAAVYAKALYNGGRYAEALRIAQTYRLDYVGGLAAYRLGDYYRAAQLLSRVPQKDETVYRLLLDTYLRLREEEKFKKTLSEVKNRYPQLYGEYLGWYYYYKGDWKKAAQHLKNPLYKAVALYNAGEYDRVLQILRGNNGTLAKLLKARALLAKGQFSKTLELLSGVNTPDADFLKGIALFAEGKYRTAAAYFERVKNYPPALLYLANCYFNEGKYREAEKLYFQFIKLYPQSPLVGDAYLGLINVYLNTGDPRLANYLLGIVEKYPNLLSEEALLKLAESFYKNGEPSKALKLASKLVKSKNPYIRGKALLLMAKLEPSKAPIYLERAVKLGIPQISSEAAVELAEYYLSHNNSRKAREVLERYGNLVSDVKTLINLYAKVGEFNRAYKLLEQMIPADNSYTVLAYDIARKYGKPEFYALALNSLDPKIATYSAYELERFYLKRGDLKDALKTVLVLKVRKIRYEPVYSKAFYLIVENLYDKGYVKDACSLLDEINTHYLTPKEKLKLEKIKKTCVGT